MSSNRIIYCFRNPIQNYKEKLNEEIDKRGLDLDVHPSYCMKLCMLCSHQLICVVNRELLVAKDEMQLQTKLAELLDEVEEEE